MCFCMINMEDLNLNAVIDELMDDPTPLPASLGDSEVLVDVEQPEIQSGAERETEENSNNLVDSRSAKRACELPLSKIKGIMKMDPDVVMIGSEAVFTVAKAAELFLQTLAKQSFKYTAANKKKTVQRAHVDSAVTSSESLFFLEDALD